MFQDLSPWLELTKFDWSAFEKYGKVRTVETNSLLYSIGNAAKSTFIIQEGRVRLFHTSYDGREKALIVMCKNAVIGDSQLRTKHFESAVTAAKTTYIEIESHLFQKMLEENKKLNHQYIEFLNRKSQTLAFLNLLGACYDSETRVRYAIYHLANQYGEPINGKGIKIFMQFTQQELADLIGTSRVTVANLVNLFVQKGLLEKEGRYYIVPCLQNLLPEA